MSTEEFWNDKPKTPSLTAWVFVIALGVFFGNTASLGLEKAITYVELKIAAQAIKESTERMMRENAENQRKMQVERAKQQAEQKRLAEQRRIEIDRKQNGLRLSIQTCNFWKQQVAKENTEFNRMTRDQACKLVREFQ